MTKPIHTTLAAGACALALAHPNAHAWYPWDSMILCAITAIDAVADATEIHNLEPEIRRCVDDAEAAFEASCGPWYTLDMAVTVEDGRASVLVAGVNPNNFRSWRPNPVDGCPSVEFETVVERSVPQRELEIPYAHGPENPHVPPRETANTAD